ncbi:MAG: hypothetical protein AAGA75_24955 [Cyanobacteria bacterium P01_E01_bin.6]
MNMGIEPKELRQDRDWPPLNAAPDVVYEYFKNQYGRTIADNYLAIVNGNPIVTVPTLNQYIAIKALSEGKGRGMLMNEICERMAVIGGANATVRHQSAVSNAQVKGLMDRLKCNGDRRFTYYLNKRGKAAIKVFEAKYGTENPIEKWAEEEQFNAQNSAEKRLAKAGRKVKEPLLGLTEYVILKTLIENNENNNLFPSNIHELALERAEKYDIALTMQNIRERIKVAFRRGYIQRRKTDIHRKPYAYSISEKGREKVTKYESKLNETKEEAA